MSRGSLKLRIAVAVAGLSFSAWFAHAADLNGAWATDASACSKVFEKKGAKTSFTDNSSLYGGGFIIEGGRITGQLGKCSIKSIKRDGSAVRIIAACSTGVMISDEQFNLKVLGENSINLISRGSGGIPPMEISYVRCSL
jgi:hypothetical protein